MKRRMTITMTPEAERLATLQAMALAAKRGDRDARRAIAAAQVKAAVRAGSPAGLAALFPGLKRKA